MALPDKYDLQARYTPAMVCSVPFFFLGFYYLNGLDGAFWHSAFAVNLGGVGLATALFSVAIHLCRAIGKLIEELYFKRGLSFPTTEFLLDGDTNLSDGRKKAILAKIKQRFGINLEHKTDDNEANRRSIHEAIGQIRSSFYKKNDLITQRNIQFGLAKNLFGGCILAIAVSLVGILASYLSNNIEALKVATILLAVYVFLTLAAALLIRFTARHYAHMLYDEFLAH